MNIQRTAYHEAGHAVMHIHLGVPFIDVSIISEEGSNGRVKTSTEGLDSSEMSADEIEANIYALFGGMAAEELKFGEISRGIGDITDTEGDYRQISDHLMTLGEFDGEPFFLRTKEILTTRWSDVEAIAQALLAKKRITFNEVLSTLAVSSNHDPGA